MTKHCKETTWIDDIHCVCMDYKLLPLNNMTQEQKFNSITRIFIFTIVILYLLDYKNINTFVLFSIIMLVCIYFIQKNNEPYNKPIMKQYPMKQYPIIEEQMEDRFKEKRSIIEGTTTYPKQYIDEVIDGTDNTGYINKSPKEWMSVNQKMAGRPNPKTLIQPVIPDRMLDVSWGGGETNNNSVMHGINRNVKRYEYESGYKSEPVETVKKFTHIDSLDVPKQGHNPLYEKSEPSNIETNSCMYDKNQYHKYGLPVNYVSNECDRKVELKEYNQDLFTQYAGPNTIIKYEVIEPINAKIGIDHALEPVNKSSMYNKNTDMIEYTYHEDSKTNLPNVFVKNCPKSVGPEDVYDPRLTGSGTNQRYYEDNNSNGIKFYYDDVNTARMPNYIVRSRIDTHSFADQYGTITTGKSLINRDNTPGFRDMVHTAYLNDTISHRTDMMESISQKMNRRKAQLRTSPITTASMGHYSGGGGGGVTYTSIS